MTALDFLQIYTLVFVKTIDRDRHNDQEINDILEIKANHYGE